MAEMAVQRLLEFWPCKNVNKLISGCLLYLRKQKKQRKLESANNVDRNLKFSSSHTGIDIQKLKFRHRGLALQCAMRNHFIELKIKVSSIELSIFDWL